MGGGDSSPPPVDYAGQAKASEEEANNQANITAQQTAAANARADQQAAAAAATAAANKTSAQQKAQGMLSGDLADANKYGISQTQSLTGGGNDYGLLSHYNDLLNSAAGKINIGGIQDDSGITPALSGLDDASIFSTAQNDVLGQQRSKLNAGLNNMYDDNYADEAIGNNYLDSYANQILGSQKTTAQKAIDAAKARGTLNDTGYQSAEDALGTASGAASSKLSTLGQGILGNYRTALTDAVNSGKSSANNWTFGSSYDPSQTSTKVNSLLNTDAQSAQGDLTNAVGGTPLFDVSSILAGAGSAQGATSGTPTTSATSGASGTGDLSSAFASAVANSNANKQRLQGNQGVA